MTDVPMLTSELKKDLINPYRLNHHTTVDFFACILLITSSAGTSLKFLSTEKYPRVL